jgi:hypothetical protein
MESRYWTEFAERHRRPRFALHVDYRIAARPMPQISARPQAGHGGRQSYRSRSSSRYHPVR